MSTKQLLCTQCKQQATQSKIILKCVHQLCEKCVYQSIANKQVTQTFSCPSCQGTLNLKQEQTAYLQELGIKYQAIQSSDQPINCQNCENLELQITLRDQELLYWRHQFTQQKGSESQELKIQNEELQLKTKNQQEAIQTLQKINQEQQAKLLSSSMISYQKYNEQGNKQSQSQEKEVVDLQMQIEQYKQIIKNGFDYYEKKIISYEESFDVCQAQLNQSQNTINELQQQIKSSSWNNSQEVKQEQFPLQIENKAKQIQLLEFNLQQQKEQDNEIIKDLKKQLNQAQNQYQILFNCFRVVKQTVDNAIVQDQSLNNQMFQQHLLQQGQKNQANANNQMFQQSLFDQGKKT